MLTLFLPVSCLVTIVFLPLFIIISVKIYTFLTVVFELVGCLFSSFRNRKIYKNGDRYYKMVKPVGSWGNYALWQPLKKFKLFGFFSSGKQFWLDDYGFEKI